MDELAFPTDVLKLRAWPDPVVDPVGHDPRSRYVEKFWLGILGPSSTWLLRHFADRLERDPDGVEMDVRVMAGSMGLGIRGGRNSPLFKSLSRCCQFGLARFFDERTILVRRSLPPLSARQLARLPEALQEEHLALYSAPARQDPRRSDMARGIAEALIGAGEPPDQVEAHLHRLGIHPAVAFDSVRRAVTNSRTANAFVATTPAGPAGRVTQPGASISAVSCDGGASRPGVASPTVSCDGGALRPVKPIPPPPAFVAELRIKN